MSGNANLTSGRLLARNSVLNLLGEVAPFLVAIVATPVLIRGVGVDRYGLLTLITLAVGYFGVFDFGLGRAASKFIAEAAVTSDHSDIPGLFWTAFFLMFGFGLCGATLLAALCPWLVTHVLNIAPSLRDEARHGFYLFALCLPFVISEGSLDGTLAAFQRFDLINAVGVPTGILYFAAPLIVLAFSHSIASIVGAIVLVRLTSWAANFVMCLHILPELRREIGLHHAAIRPLLSFGGWLTIASIASPIMEYADRFIIGAMLSVAAVAYYAVPYQVTNKLRMIPWALSGVVFPALASSLVQDSPRAAILFDRATRYTIFAVFPPALLIVTLAPEGLGLWLGPTFAGQSTAVMRWLAIAVFVNCIAVTPCAFIQAAHRPDLIAKLYSVEMPAFLLLLWWILPRYGLEGAAAAYAIRVGFDAVISFIVARRLLPILGATIVRVAQIAFVALLGLVVGILPMTLLTKIGFVGGVFALYVLVCWKVLLDSDEKEFIREHLRIARVVLNRTPIEEIRHPTGL